MKNITCDHQLPVFKEPVKMKDSSGLLEVVLSPIIQSMNAKLTSILLYGFQSMHDMIYTMPHYYRDMCNYASDILRISGYFPASKCLVSPIFVEDNPVEGEEFPIMIPAGISVNGTVYSFDLETVYSVTLRNKYYRDQYADNARKLYAEPETKPETDPLPSFESDFPCE